MLPAIKQACLIDNIPIISDATRDFLINHLRTHQPEMVCEIGAAAGYSSIVIAQELTAWGGKCVSFDISYPQYKKSIQNKSKSGLTNLTCYHADGTKTNFQKVIYKKIDRAFVDGQKAVYHTFVQALLPLMKQGGHIICDDCIKFRNKVTPLYEYLHQKQINYQAQQLELDDGIILITV